MITKSNTWSAANFAGAGKSLLPNGAGRYLVDKAAMVPVTASLSSEATRRRATWILPSSVLVAIDLDQVVDSFLVLVWSTQRED